MADIVVKESDIKGKGVFAARDFKKGEVIMVWDTSDQCTAEELKTLSQEDQNHTSYGGKGKYILMQEPEKYVNHSCDPNTYVKNFQDIALRDIKKGDEITTDYSLNCIDDWELECQCGSPQCRKIVYGDFKKLSSELQQKYEPYLEDWYKEEFR